MLESSSYFSDAGPSKHRPPETPDGVTQCTAPLRTVALGELKGGIRDHTPQLLKHIIKLEMEHSPTAQNK